MKTFTESDIHNEQIFANSEDLIYAPLEWQKQGLQETATGYGSRLTTSKKISFNGKLYRVYCTCWSNAGSCWFKVKGRKIYVS